MSRECQQCGTRFDPRRKGSWRLIEAWVVERGSDAQGGTNAVREPRDLGPVLCPVCGRLRALGVIPGQASLL